jgi:TnpA family transposase
MLSVEVTVTTPPRMRTWADVTFYRPAKSIRYHHIESLFTGEIDWKLIATHWQDIMQVVLSIQAGRVMPSMLLRKLGTYNRKSRLYRAFRELGSTERTLFPLLTKVLAAICRD